ncbi:MULTISPECIES: roadblock/LC7 domain-containing protein [Methanobacterium]|jgi:predicted regulator of Ras-like GTPase activity (Roadblock/LC7/MglB family)|uniref:Roadblock/LC7 domain-containing protein n=1 Tax=Methanobacterium veterum TaxID=408577 RepID=A0A9E5DJQ0_9EURY|nr:MULTISPECIES: roadblock/LC7 domain-containing protein [Methanobacterium]MCZ3366477.1 roadblock/LC7 domain-containing protein [Methanobacterium veterum]MCZ3371985.1 roadblock/LC7 domain-containing protein [Methanobacterium veterum]
MKLETNFEKALISINRITGVKDSVLAGLDGIPISKLDENTSILSATTAAALGAVREMIRSISYGNLEKLIVETDSGKIIIEEFGNRHVIIVLTENSANIGMIRVTLKKVVREYMDN